MENKKRGRPMYKIDVKLLNELIKKVNNKEISNKEAYYMAKCGKTKWFQIKKMMEVK